MYVYNEDAIDGINGCDCPGVNTYCDDVPMLGIDILRGPRGPIGFCDTVPWHWLPTEDIIFIDTDHPFQDSLRIICGERRGELEMSSFTYYNNASVGSWPNAMTDPSAGAPLEFYRHLSGSWKDGAPFCRGDAGYLAGPGCQRTKYAFHDPPNDHNGWSMATASLPFGDRRTVQSVGPMRLDPGEVNEILLGVIWVPHIEHPNPDLARLFSADGYAQALFDNCFKTHIETPDAPDLQFVELDKELILMLSNNPVTSNNAFEQFSTPGPHLPAEIEDDHYVFEGYQVYQLSGPHITLADRDDVSKVRLVYQCDLANGISNIYNWSGIDDPEPFATEPIWLPELKVQGADQGIRHTVRITEDQFATGDKKLVNYKKYYFTAVAYAHNEYAPFDPETTIGQRTPYLEGRSRTYEAIPRPYLSFGPGRFYGAEPIVTRLSGAGAGHTFLDITDDSRAEILAGTNDGEVVYQIGAAPIEIQVTDPLIVKKGCFILEFFDHDGLPSVLDANARWRLYPENTSTEITLSHNSIFQKHEQVIDRYGFSVTIGQTPDAGDQADTLNGAIGIEITTGQPWLTWIEEEMPISTLITPVFDFIKPDGADPDEAFTTVISSFYPFHLCDYRKMQPKENLHGYIVTPGWLDLGEGSLQTTAMLGRLNNVDIVLTRDKSKWSRCIVVETANSYFTDLGLTTAGGSKNMERRNAPSVTKDDHNGDGLPDIDPNESDYGLGWFPGYVIDVETGQRLNVFFGENSIYNDFFQDIFPEYPANGDDLMWNPGKEIFTASGANPPPVSDFSVGGMQYVYLTLQPYDGCESLLNDFKVGGTLFNKLKGLSNITWTGIPLSKNFDMLSYADGLIPNDMLIKIRVDNPYQMTQNADSTLAYPRYRFCFDGIEPDSDIDPTGHDTTVAMLPVSPLIHASGIDITQLTDQSRISIYAMDGKLVKQLMGGDLPLVQQADLTELAGRDLPGGVYLIHFQRAGFTDKVVKVFLSGSE